jgi:hypothetical protein
VKRRDGEPDRATLRRQRSETFWADVRAAAAETPRDLALVEWRRLRTRAKQAGDPAAVWLETVDVLRKLGDRL